MVVYGADVEQLRSLASSFEGFASRVDADRVSVSNGIRVRAWFGPFAVRFRINWDSEYSRMLHAVAVDLRRAATELKQNADEQDRTSASGTSASGYAPYAIPNDVRVDRGEPVNEDPPRGAWDPASVIREFSHDGTYSSGVSIRTITYPDGTKAYIVYIPGTQDWFGTSGNVYNGADNLALVAQQQTRATRAVLEAMRQEGIPPDAPVMLCGHSQGGLIAGNLASDSTFRSNYNLEGVLVYGADIRERAIPSDVAVTQVTNSVDVVPHLTNLSGTNHISNLNSIEFTKVNLSTAYEHDTSVVGRISNFNAAVNKAIGSPIGEHTNNQDYSGAAIEWYLDNQAEWDAEYSSFKGGGGATSTMTRYGFAE